MRIWKKVEFLTKTHKCILLRILFSIRCFTIYVNWRMTSYSWKLKCSPRCIFDWFEKFRVIIFGKLFGKIPVRNCASPFEYCYSKFSKLKHQTLWFRMIQKLLMEPRFFKVRYFKLKTRDYAVSSRDNTSLKKSR